MIPRNGTYEADSNGSKSPNFLETESFVDVPNAVAAIMHIMYFSVSFLAVGGNGMVCYIIIAHQRMRTVTNFFILNLAVGDILMASLCIPFGFVSNLLLQYWPFGAAMCVIVSYAQAVSVFVSAYTLISISIDRYIAILYPLRLRVTKLQAKLIIVVVWIVALITPLPTAILSRLEVHPAWTKNNGTQRYVCMEAWQTAEQRYHYSMALMILQYFFPLAVLLFTYSRIGVVVWGNKPPGEAEDNRDQRLAASKRKMIRMMIVVVTTFALCWLPLNALIVAGDQDSRIWQYEHIVYVWFACHWLAMSHAAHNPVIYCWMSDRFREGFMRILKRLHCGLGRTTQTNVGMHRCKTYTAYSTANKKAIRNGEQGLAQTLTVPVQHVCKYDGCFVDGDLVSDSAV